MKAFRSSRYPNLTPASSSRWATSSARARKFLEVVMDLAKDKGRVVRNRLQIRVTDQMTVSVIPDCSDQATDDSSHLPVVKSWSRGEIHSKMNSFVLLALFRPRTIRRDIHPQWAFVAKNASDSSEWNCDSHIGWRVERWKHSRLSILSIRDIWSVWIIARNTPTECRWSIPRANPAWAKIIPLNQCYTWKSVHSMFAVERVSSRKRFDSIHKKVYRDRDSPMCGQLVSQVGRPSFIDGQLSSFPWGNREQECH
jgi:hypothetical protein